MRLVLLGIVLVIAVVFLKMLPDIRRYVRMRSM